MELEQGQIRPLVVPLKVFISALGIGAGGSAGRVDPVVVMGAGIGSSAAQFLNLDEEQIKTLLASGAAGGIAATFNAPIAGVLFAEEIILKEFKLSYFSPIVVASITATAVSQNFLGAAPFFEGLTFQLVSYWEFIPYLFLGLLMGGLALIFTNSLGFLLKLFKNLQVPYFLKPALGGLLVGLIGYFLPQVYGTGNPIIEQALHGPVLIPLALALIVAKIIATSCFIGSGGSGGLFAPALFIGGWAGNFFGQISAKMLPGLAAVPGSYAVIGMGAMFAGLAHAPLTAILFIFELTRDYQIMLPIMLASIVSFVLAEQLQKTNIYTIDLAARGIDVFSDRKGVLLKKIKIREVMTADPVVIKEDTPLSKVHQLVREEHHTHFPVVKRETGEVVGVLSYNHILDTSPGDNVVTAGELVDSSPLCLTPADSLENAYNLIQSPEIKLICIVDEEQENKLVGVVNRGDILSAYHRRLSADSLHF